MISLVINFLKPVCTECVSHTKQRYFLGWTAKHASLQLQ